MTTSEEEFEKYLQDLNESTSEEVINFYESALEIFTEKEMYEDCVKVHYLIESVKLFKNKVV
jgi:hypothetical protein